MSAHRQFALKLAASLLAVIGLIAASNPDTFGRAAGHHQVSPLTPRSPFGAIAFDILPTYPPTPPPGQEPRYPLWSPPPACMNNVSAPPLLEADDPETWNLPNFSSWGGHQAVDLEHDTFSSSGLVTYYFWNKYSVATHLYVGTIVSGATFKWAAGTAIGPANFQQLGTNAETTFLQDYETTTGFTSAVAGTGSTPKPFFTITIGSGQLATGEIAIENLSAPTAFFLYADGCSTGCPSIQFNAPDDTHLRRGEFPGAAMTIVHDYTEELYDNNGGWSYWDLGRPTPGPTATPYPVTIDICATPLPGFSKVDNKTTYLNGWYGAPITITGTSKYFDEDWYVNPQYPAPFNVAVWVSGFTNRATGNPVLAQAYSLPYPSPSPTPWIGDTNHAFVLGGSKLGTTRTIIYIPSPGGYWPVRFYYVDP